MLSSTQQLHERTSDSHATCCRCFVSLQMLLLQLLLLQLLLQLLLVLDLAVNCVEW